MLGLKRHNEKNRPKTKGKEKTFHFNEVSFLSQPQKKTGTQSVTHTASAAIKSLVQMNTNVRISQYPASGEGDATQH